MNEKIILILLGISIVALLIPLQPKKEKQNLDQERPIVQERPIIVIKEENNDLLTEIRRKQQNFEKLGVVYSQSGTDNTILELLGRMSLVQRTRYVYKVRDPDTGLTLDLNDGEPMNELYTGDTVSVLGRSGLFIVNITKKNFVY